MSFEPERYKRQVIEPLQRRNIVNLPDDLLIRYAIDLTVMTTDQQVREQVARVRRIWNKGADSQSNAERGVYRALLREDRILGKGLEEIKWWREWTEKHVDKRQRDVGELISALKHEYGEVGLATPAELAAMQAAFPQLTSREVEEAIAQAGIHQIMPIDLPESSGLPEVLYKGLRGQLEQAGIATLVELLYPGITRFRVLTEFRTEPSTTNGLSKAAVDEAKADFLSRSGDEAARDALHTLSSEMKRGLDLRQLTVFHLLEEARACAPSTSQRILLRLLQQRKLHPDDARQAVVSLRAESDRRPLQGGLPQVRKLLDTGQLRAARQALASATDSADTELARSLVEGQAERVRQLTARAHEALRSTRPDAEEEARRALMQAVTLASDDGGLAAELDRVPLTPALAVTAEHQDAGVRVSWRADAGHNEGTRYRLVRKADRPAVNPADGTIVIETKATTGLDTDVTPAQPIGYTVFASADGTIWSRAASTTTDAVLPPVRDVQMQTGHGVVEAHWDVHQDAISVEVRRVLGEGPPRPRIR